MDPDENVREQNRILADMRAGQTFDLARLQELRTALREWTAKGGFPPTPGAWATTP